MTWVPRFEAFTLPERPLSEDDREPILTAANGLLRDLREAQAEIEWLRRRLAEKRGEPVR